jgi:hypothetical protein
VVPVDGKSLAPRFLLVQRGEKRFLNPFADQPDQEFVLRRVVGYRSANAHFAGSSCFIL